MDTNISELEAPKPAKKPGVFPCYQCNSTAHRVKECPIATSMVKNEIKNQMKAMKGGKGGKGNKGKWGGQGGQGGKNKGKGSVQKNAENIKKEPKN